MVLETISTFNSKKMLSTSTTVQQDSLNDRINIWERACSPTVYSYFDIVPITDSYKIIKTVRTETPGFFTIIEIKEV